VRDLAAGGGPRSSSSSARNTRPRREFWVKGSARAPPRPTRWRRPSELAPARTYARRRNCLAAGWPPERFAAFAAHLDSEMTPGELLARDRGGADEKCRAPSRAGREGRPGRRRRARQGELRGSVPRGGPGFRAGRPCAPSICGGAGAGVARSSAGGGRADGSRAGEGAGSEPAGGGRGGGGAGSGPASRRPIGRRRAEAKGRNTRGTRPGRPRRPGGLLSAAIGSPGGTPGESA
jgi:hypothetical protein